MRYMLLGRGGSWATPKAGQALSPSVCGDDFYTEQTACPGFQQVVVKREVAQRGLLGCFQEVWSHGQSNMLFRGLWSRTGQGCPGQSRSLRAPVYLEGVEILLMPQVTSWASRVQATP